MTNDQPGPELDRRVAVAMGWTELRWHERERLGPTWRHRMAAYIGNPPCGSSPAPLIRWVPAYSTDPARIPEMEAHILTTADAFWIESISHRPCLSTRVAHAQRNKPFLQWYANGLTTQHALALLIDAIAEQQGETDA